MIADTLDMDMVTGVAWAHATSLLLLLPLRPRLPARVRRAACGEAARVIELLLLVCADTRGGVGDTAGRVLVLLMVLLVMMMAIVALLLKKLAGRIVLVNATIMSSGRRVRSRHGTERRAVLVADGGL